MKHSYTVVQHAPQQQYSWHRHENDNSSTPHQFSWHTSSARFSCCMHRLKRSRVSPPSPGSQPGTLTTASGAGDAVDVSHRQELWTSSPYCCCCEPEFDPALLQSQHDAFDSQSTLHLGAVAARLGSKRRPRSPRAEATRAARWWPWLDSKGVTFSLHSTIGVPAVDYSGSIKNCLLLYK